MKPPVPFYCRDGITIVDATEELSLKVTSGDIARATAGDNKKCAIAQCVLRYGRTKSKKLDFNDVSVGHAIVLILRSDGLWYRYMIHREDRKMIRYFDEKRMFRVGTYVLLPPPSSRRIGARIGEKSGSNIRAGKSPTVTKQAASQTRPRPEMAIR